LATVGFVVGTGSCGPRADKNLFDKILVGVHPEMFAYYKETAVGTFWIKPDKFNGWGLVIEHDGDWEVLGSYLSPAAAADDVFTQHTGYSPWDDPARHDAPSDLGEWQKHKIK
jgi:hypothetical protein